ncbi:hypothetical protein HAX54_039731 [Datura stramonium]|uniref:Uncharacterized protein n=1 Tax=Datura stramonium TaxID=4076 RepID=A0ABS8VLP4_DATST|nr:hypothetical protein [Datura stramonium]
MANLRRRVTMSLNISKDVQGPNDSIPAFTLSGSYQSQGEAGIVTGTTISICIREKGHHPAVRRDRWREGEKELGDVRKPERWSSLWQTSREARRVPGEDGLILEIGKAINDQRRESKWNTRWGPDGKESDASVEKWSNPSKDAEVHLEKGSVGLAYHGKDESVGDYYRPWRATSHGRGRGRALSGGSPMNTRALLICSHLVHSQRKLNGIVQVPSLTQDEPVEPLALCAPSPEELPLLRDLKLIFTWLNGAPQITKDGTLGRNSTDYTQPRRNKLGSREDLSLDDSREESTDNAKGVYLNHTEGAEGIFVDICVSLDVLQFIRMQSITNLNVTEFQEKTVSLTEKVSLSIEIQAIPGHYLFSIVA